MATAIETERLILRTRDERDAEWYRELVGERGEDTPTIEEATARLAQFRDLGTEIGIGALTICLRDGGEPIGYCALIVGRATLDEPEIAYELLKRYHGHGYATEAAAALVRRCRRDGPAPPLVDRRSLEHAVPAGAREDRLPAGPRRRHRRSRRDRLAGPGSLTGHATAPCPGSSSCPGHASDYGSWTDGGQEREIAVRIAKVVDNRVSAVVGRRVL